MLHAGLDLSRRRVDYCLLDEDGERVEVGEQATQGCAHQLAVGQLDGGPASADRIHGSVVEGWPRKET